MWKLIKVKDIDKSKKDDEDQNLNASNLVGFNENMKH